ncbi:hypothetical protein [Arenimonas sp. MALMAid1274]|uniref:hypothetical protein n=1 Tax=Arenimonas sp. MALMAid1274 TaxID=3411630 RepID=UPI003BA2F3F7
MANTNNPNDQERLTMEDDAFRRSMRERQDPQAKAWVALDGKAEALEDQVGRGTREVDRRASSVFEIERDMTDARTARDDFRAENERPGLLSGERKQWDERYQGLEGNVAGLQKDFTEAVSKASPEELDALQAQIGQRRDELVKTIEVRQGIARLPSEQGQGEDLHAQVAEGMDTPLLERRGQRGGSQQEDERGQGEGAASGGSYRQRPNFGAYATTVDEATERKQLEEDQRTLHQQLGQPATDAQVQRFERERTERQEQERQQANQAGNGASATPSADAPTAKRGVEAAGQAVQEDLSVQAAAAIAPPLSELRAARTEKQAQADQGQAQGTQHKRDWGQESGQGM